MAEKGKQPALRQVSGPEGPIFYELTRKKVKNLNLRVRGDGSVAASAPMGISLAQVDAFVADRAGWIAQARRRLEARRPGDIRLAALLGRGVPFDVAPAERAAVEARQGRLLLRLPPDWLPEQGLDDFRRQKALPVLSRALQLAQARFEEQDISLPPVRKLRLIPMKSRWGSCIPGKGQLALNVHLMKKPFACAEYVAVHELCHLLEPNHGPGFYRLMDQVLPDHRQRKQLLRQPDPGI